MTQYIYNIYDKINSILRFETYILVQILLFLNYIDYIWVKVSVFRSSDKEEMLFL